MSNISSGSAPSPTKTAKSDSTGRGGKNANTLPIAIGLLVATVCGLLVVFVFGSIQGEEFNPATFQRQTFRFVQIPIVGWQVVPTKYKDITGDAERSIAVVLGISTTASDPGFTEEDFDDGPGATRSKTATPDPATTAITAPIANSRWDLVSSDRTSAPPWFGDAKILCDSLDIRDHNSNSLWEQWTKDHPQAAKVLWPVIAKTAQANLYILVPDLLDSATNEPKATSLRPLLARQIEKDAVALGEIFMAGNKPERARSAFALAIAYAPNSVAAAKGLASAQAAVTAENSEQPKGENNKQDVRAEVEGEFETVR